MRVLLIMPRFFDYPQIISEELKRMGYEVDFYDDRPSTNGWIKALIRINRNLLSHYISRYFRLIMKDISSKKYDFVLLISGQSLSFSEEMIKEIKEKQVQARFVLYQWDSVVNFPYIEKMQKYFDKCYSFDRRDTNDNSNLKFLPLFYCDRYEQLGKLSQNDYKYDFCFVGTAHPKKYKFIRKMSEQLKTVYPNQYIYFFFPSRLVFIYRKIKNKEFRSARYSEFHYEPLNSQEMSQLIQKSRIILDSAQEGQAGLTIRVLETLGAKKKLITTNTDIKNYDFYREENIYVYEGTFDFDSLFFQKPYVKVEESIYGKYSLRSWLQELLC